MKNKVGALTEEQWIGFLADAMKGERESSERISFGFRFANWCEAGDKLGFKRQYWNDRKGMLHLYSSSNERKIEEYLLGIRND